jgi:HSP20 family molecular chaperone IbpA
VNFKLQVRPSTRIALPSEPSNLPIARQLLAAPPVTWFSVNLGSLDTDKAYEITAELPGMDEKNVEVKFTAGVLTIKGEKTEEKEETKKDYHLSERRYGSFQRSFTVPDGIDADKIDATFKDGVLTVGLPKTPEAQKKAKQIAIKKG